MSYPFLPARLAEVRERIAEACFRSGRDASGVTLVAVTKTHPADAVTSAVACGIPDVGENKVQELEGKVAELGRNAARWHLIGHLQTNKVKKAVELADLIHSVDSLKLAQKISEEALARGVTVDGLVQVNLGGEETKGGLEPEEALEGIGAICELQGVRIKGLMTMAPFTDDQGVIRKVFKDACALREAAAASFPSFHPVHMSMGMSNDFEIAVEEGATLLRLGTVLFGERGT
jgi:PLP dependent protein